VVITTAEFESGAAVERAKLLGVPAARIGTVTGGDTLDIVSGEIHLSWQLSELHDVWWNTIARAMES
jgi:hypothetical protein